MRGLQCLEPALLERSEDTVILAFTCQYRTRLQHHTIHELMHPRMRQARFYGLISPPLVNLVFVIPIQVGHTL